MFSNYVLSLLEYQIIILETQVRLWNQKRDSIVLASRLHLISSTICVESFIVAVHSGIMRFHFS